MKTKQTRINLMEGGRKKLENTAEFRSKVEKIRKEAMNQYSSVLLNEKSWMKRLFIKIRLQLEIKKRIEELSSWRNLHFINR